MKLNWQNEDIAKALIFDKTLYSFIFQMGSLTRFIQAQCHGQFHVEVKSESWQQALVDEATLINVNKNEHVFIRESWLKCDNAALIYARTVIPKRILVGKYKRLVKLGNQPLGDILFTDESAYRSNMRYAKIPLNYKLYQQIFDSNKVNSELWARQSLFYIKNNPLLIIEFFLPELIHAFKNKNCS